MAEPAVLAPSEPQTISSQENVEQDDIESGERELAVSSSDVNMETESILDENGDGESDADADPVLLWPEESSPATVLPSSTFHIVGPEEGPAEGWPHPSAWDIPGNDWEDLEDTTDAKDPDPEQ